MLRWVKNNLNFFFKIGNEIIFSKIVNIGITSNNLIFDRLVYSSVPDLGSRIRDVVLVRRIFNSGKPQGVGILEWGGNGRGWKWGDQFTSNLGPRWTGSYHIKEGFQVSKGKMEGKQKGIRKGKQKARGCAIIVLSLYKCTY
jgi:hypothetical protein